MGIFSPELFVLISTQQVIVIKHIIIVLRLSSINSLQYKTII